MGTASDELGHSHTDTQTDLVTHTPSAHLFEVVKTVHDGGLGGGKLGEDVQQL